MASESLSIDPTSEASTNAQVDLWDSAGGVAVSNQQFPAPEQEMVTAGTSETEGDPLLSTRHKNRTITVTLNVTKSTAAALDTKVDQLQQKVAKLFREGGTLKRTLRSGNVIVFDVLTADIDVPADWYYLQRNVAKDVTITMTCRPYGRGPAVTGSDNVEITLPCLIFTVASVKGDVPALGQLLYDEDQAADQLFVLACLRSRYYSSATTAKLFYEAETLTLGNAAQLAAVSGASGGTVARGTATNDYLSMLSTQATGGGAHMTHIGGHRVWARVQAGTANTGTASLRLSWAEGDFARYTSNDPVDLPPAYAGTKRLVDLGPITPQKARKGAQRWRGQVEIKSTVVGDLIDVDCIEIAPTDEWYAEVHAAPQKTTPSSLLARDEFNQAAGTANGKVLPQGGTWVGVGTAADFSVVASSMLQRSGTADSSFLAGRHLLAGTATYASVGVEAGIQLSALPGIVHMSSVECRYVDTNNYLAGGLLAAGGIIYLELVKIVAGANTILAGKALDLSLLTSYTIRVEVDAAGRWFFWNGDALVANGSDPVLATGGALASGRIGVYDITSESVAVTRTYRNFKVFTPSFDAAVYASQSLELRHDGAVREDSAGTVWANRVVEGNNLLIPPAGREGRTAQVMVLGSRGEPLTMEDSAIDDRSAQLTYVPRYLNVPDA